MLRYRSRNGDNLKLVTSQVSGGHPYLSTGAGHIGGQGPYAQGPCRSKNPAINASYIRHTYIHTCAHTYTPAHTSHTYVVMCAHTCVHAAPHQVVTIPFRETHIYQALEPPWGRVTGPSRLQKSAFPLAFLLPVTFCQEH